MQIFPAFPEMPDGAIIQALTRRRLGWLLRNVSEEVNIAFFGNETVYFHKAVFPFSTFIFVSKRHIYIYSDSDGALIMK
jgi:hypothetical protein